MDNFAFLDTPGGPEGVKVVELFVFEKYFSCFLDGGATQDFSPLIARVLAGVAE